MSVFPSAGHLASWAGLAPGSHESAGRVKSSKTRPGNRYLKGALGIAALSAARFKNTYFSAKYQRITTRRGPMRAIVAVEHAMIIAAYTMLTTGEVYRDPGTDHYTKHQSSEPKPEPLPNSNPSATGSPWNHSPNPPDPPTTTVTRCGHPIFVSGPVVCLYALGREGK
jgi:hypothetical protein